MKFTDIFVRRPVLALVVSALIVLIGLFALSKLPIRQYPQLESSTITITTQYPGASAKLMQGFVTQPIAQAVSSVEGVDYLSSSSVQGSSLVTVRMELNRDSTQALAQVMAKVNQVRYKLPKEAYDPVIELSSGESTAVAYIGFSSTNLSIPALTDYISRVIEPMYSSIDGVAKVQVFGGQQLAMRLWLDADKLAGRGLTAADVAQAVRQNNYQAAPGKVKGEFVISNVYVNTDLTNVDEFRDLVIRNDGNGLVRLKDVGTIELGAASTETSGLMNGEPAIYLGLFATPTGNPLVIVDGMNQLMPDITKTLPPGVKVEMAFETSRFIKASIDQVISTLVEALLIVIAVIYLCLGSIRSVIIPILAIPLSMLGAAALMMAFGFSINLLTLLAMVLAIGLVVDDAIVVVENVHRHIEEGKSPVLAALIGAREVAGPVIAMTITLAAVYAPIGLMSGLTGALFKEFALTLAGAVIVSGIVALTLSPVMSSFMLNSKQNEGRMARMAETFFSTLAHYYTIVLNFSLKNRWLTGVIAVGVFISLPLLYQSAPRELAPVEDQSSVLTAIKSPQHANLEYVERFSRKLHDVFMELTETESTWIINGTDGPSASFGGTNLTSWEQRDRAASEIQGDLQGRVGDVEGNSIFVFQLPALPGSTGGLPIQMVLRSPQDYSVLYKTMEEIKQQARESGLFMVVDSDLDYNNPVVEVRINRSKANSLGIRMQDIGESLTLLVGENYINRFGMDGRSYDVIPQSIRSQRLTPEALSRHYVKSEAGTMIPLSTVVDINTQVEPNKLTQFNQQNAAIFQAIPAPAVTLGQAVAYLDNIANELPAGFSHDWQSDSRQYKQEGNTLAFAFMAALIIIYLVLAAQYESLVDPLIILITVPLSICGALIPLALGYATLNIYTQIGLVTLIGLISKHGILMVEFANELQANEGLDRRHAILKAAQIRLRPILMTTAAMVIGLVPLLFATGAGANSRFGLGLVIVTGMLVGTLFTLFVLPTIYTLLARNHSATALTPRRYELAEANRLIKETEETSQ
ncbi:MexW/MexI family multidrug efflux RND transporter permease subunit [Providencia sp. PROV153]|uniref:MexW/MexI family multidrug efflux RND transporter permease subunit n=1 Tax=Providencia sp. PROV153 TaxID=2949863 RepID=UPI00234A0FA5|nr:MexW/MexI family multidrug efflux RND transporter permease subunit [Providencia sp. PROV153]